jgi:hypothetical protein
VLGEEKVDQGCFGVRGGGGGAAGWARWLARPKWSNLLGSNFEWFLNLKLELI